MTSSTDCSAISSRELRFGHDRDAVRVARPGDLGGERAVVDAGDLRRGERDDLTDRDRSRTRQEIVEVASRGSHDHHATGTCDVRTALLSTPLSARGTWSTSMHKIRPRLYIILSSRSGRFCAVWCYGCSTGPLASPKPRGAVMAPVRIVTDSTVVPSRTLSFANSTSASFSCSSTTGTRSVPESDVDLDAFYLRLSEMATIFPVRPKHPSTNWRRLFASGCSAAMTRSGCSSPKR